jgi:hypothetical protein
MLKQLGRWIAVGITLVIGVVASAQQGRWAAQSDETTQSLVNMERQWAEADCDDNPTLTTIARIIHWKGERRIRPCRDQSQIFARLDGSPIVDPYFRPQWLPNFANIRAHCGIRSSAAKT